MKKLFFYITVNNDSADKKSFIAPIKPIRIRMASVLLEEVFIMEKLFRFFGIKMFLETSMVPCLPLPTTTGNGQKQL
jgi:hypothetical protein